MKTVRSIAVIGATGMPGRQPFNFDEAADEFIRYYKKERFKKNHRFISLQFYLHLKHEKK